MTLEILVATVDDLTTILDLQKECYQTEAELHDEYNIPPLTQNRESIQDDFRQGTLFLKGVIDGQIIASARGFTKNDTTYIGRLIVKKEFQNNKFGQSLMHFIESRLDNCTRYELFTGFKSERNIYLYKKLGYKEFKRQAINDKLTLVFMEKIIGYKKL